MNKKRPSIDDIKTISINGNDKHLQLYLGIILGLLMISVIILGIFCGVYIIN
jgi:cytoskeletal protein RodZ